MKSTLSLLLAASGLFATLAPADNVGWKPVWEDDFQRAELGPNWQVVSGQARIVDERLFLTGTGATVLIDRGFAPDVRVEFVAEANPDLPPCDLSVALGANPLWGYHYLLAFGGRNNRVNQILGTGPRVRDEDPPFLIEHGRSYTIEATKEGGTLTLVVNGTQLVEAVDPDPVGGPGFDRVGLVTWNGMYVDRVRVYERAAPTDDARSRSIVLPDTGYRWTNRRIESPAEVSPTFREAAEAYNRRDLARALALLGDAPPTRSRVVLQAYVLGDLAYEATSDERERLAADAQAVASRTDSETGWSDFALAAQWFSQLTIASRDRKAAIRLASLGPDNNPFYYKAQLFQARYLRAVGLEGADRKRIEQAGRIFRQLLEIWPEHGGLRELNGERVPWGPELTRPESDGPAWARHLQELFARHQTVLNWWFTHRQTPDGQLGGGWGDDVEILRGWVPAACISSACEPAIAGIERLAEGVWRHALVDSYSPDPGDVEHSAEPSADALPPMMLLRYGDPLWVERNLRSARHIRENFMAINDRGRLQFLSAEFGAEGVHRQPEAGGDTGYHARAMKHFLWLAWYGIPEAREIYLQWCETWREATMSHIGTKPVGVIPASIFYPSGGIDPPTDEPWYHSGSHYYGYPGLPNLILESFVAAYALSGEIKYLDAVQTVLDLGTTGPLRQYDAKLPPDHPNNLLAQAAHQCGPNLLAVYQWSTNDHVYHPHLVKLALTGRQRYLAGSGIDEYLNAFSGPAASLRYNWALRTSEVLQTDRAGLEGSAEVMSAYTGAVRDLTDAAWPTFAATWITPDVNFAAVVTDATPARLRVRLYNFNTAPMRMAVRPWQLMPGRYAVNAGQPVPGERPDLERYAWVNSLGSEQAQKPDHPARGGLPTEVIFHERAEPVWFDLPPQTEWVLDLRCREEFARPTALPDLAIDARDVRRESDRLHVVIHNIGGCAAPPFDVMLRDATGELDRAQVAGLPAISNLQPVTLELDLPAPSSQTFEILIDPDNHLAEISKQNNRTLVSTQRPADR